MDTGIYVALSKEVGILHNLDVVSNNIANMTTTGFQGEELLFTDFLSSTTPQENKVAFANDIGTFRNMEQGSLQETGAPLDAAIEGAGYFVVQTPLGPRYTRNGNFKVNQNGELVTSDGYIVQDVSGQPVTFDDLDRVIEIREDGTISVDQTERAQLKIVQFDNEQLLHRTGNTLFSSDAPPRLPQDFRVISGVLERSNVQPFTQITRLIAISRDLANFTQYINSTYTMENKMTDTLGKIYT
jgi:flagellar basal-body rod protein FlgF